MGVILGPVYAFVDDGSDPLNNGVKVVQLDVRVVAGELVRRDQAERTRFHEQSNVTVSNRVRSDVNPTLTIYEYASIATSTFDCVVLDRDLPISVNVHSSDNVASVQLNLGLLDVGGCAFCMDRAVLDSDTLQVVHHDRAKNLTFAQMDILSSGVNVHGRGARAQRLHRLNLAPLDRDRAAALHLD